MPFKPVPNRVDYVALEHDVQAFWDANDIAAQVPATATRTPTQRWSFIDGPITANNPMGVHHAWGRSYKDLYQRFKTMRGFKLALPERLRLPGPLDRGRGREGARLPLQARHRALRRRRVRRGLQGARTALRRPDHASNRSASATGWTGTTATSPTRTRTTTRSGASSRSAGRRAGSTRATTPCPGAPHCGTAMSQQEIVTEGYQETSRTSPSTSSSRTASTSKRSQGRVAAGLDDDALDAARQRRGRRAPGADLRPRQAGRRGLLRLEGRRRRPRSRASTRSSARSRAPSSSA